MIEDEIRAMSNDKLLAQINGHDPYDVEFVRRFHELEAARDRLRKALSMWVDTFDDAALVENDHAQSNQADAFRETIAALQTDTDTGG